MGGLEDGSTFAFDEYGHRPGQPQYSDQQRAEKEWELRRRAKEAWARKRVGRSLAHVDDTMEMDETDDKLMQEYLEKHGIKAR